MGLLKLCLYHDLEGIVKSREEEEEEKMKRIMICRCSLDLQLSPPSSSSSSESTNLHSQSMTTTCSSSTDQMTIFHRNIKPVCLCDPIEIQAIDILLFARGEMEKKLKFSITDTYMPVQVLHGSYSGLSLKRSLQRFLEKRRHRIQSAIPYN